MTRLIFGTASPAGEKGICNKDEEELVKVGFPGDTTAEEAFTILTKPGGVIDEAEQSDIIWIKTYDNIEQQREKLSRLVAEHYGCAVSVHIRKPFKGVDNYA
jgi:hypothetical protein